MHHMLDKRPGFPSIAARKGGFLAAFCCLYDEISAPQKLSSTILMYTFKLHLFLKDALTEKSWLTLACLNSEIQGTV